MTLNDTHLETLEKAAKLLAAGWAGPAHDMLASMMIETASHHNLAGAGAHSAWIASMRALGESCLTIARLSDQKFKAANR